MGVSVLGPNWWKCEEKETKGRPPISSFPFLLLLIQTPPCSAREPLNSVEKSAFNAYCFFLLQIPTTATANNTATTTYIITTIPSTGSLWNNTQLPFSLCSLILVMNMSIVSCFLLFFLCISLNDNACSARLLGAEKKFHLSNEVGVWTFPFWSSLLEFYLIYRIY